MSRSQVVGNRYNENEHKLQWTYKTRKTSFIFCTKKQQNKTIMSI